MGKLSDTALEKKIGLKRIRSRARLEASIMVDRLLNDVEEEFLDEFDRRVAAGEPFTLHTSDTWVAERVRKGLPK